MAEITPNVYEFTADPDNAFHLRMLDAAERGDVITVEKLYGRDRHKLGVRVRFLDREKFLVDSTHELTQRGRTG